MRKRKEHRSFVRACLVSAVTVAAVVGLTGCGPAEVAKPDKPYLFLPPPPEAPRMQFLCHLRSAEDFADPKSKLAEFLVGEDTEEYKTIAKGYGIAFRDGKVFCTDTKSFCVAVMNFRDRRFEMFGRDGPGQLRKPTNIRVGPDGLLYIADTVRQQVVVFDTDGKYVTEYGDGTEFKPVDVIVTEDELYILDIAAHCIKVYDLRSRKLKRTLGVRGQGFGEYSYPNSMVMDGEGNILVCDAMNFRIQKIDRNGKWLSQFGRAGRTPGHFARPRGLAIDRDGIVYVSDAVLGIVQLFDTEGKPLMHFGETGIDEGRLYLPAQVTLDYDNIEVFRKYIAPDFDVKYLILVINQLGENKVSVFAFGTGPAIAVTTQPTTAPATQPSTPATTQPK